MEYSRVASDPAKVGHAAEAVVGVNVKAVLHGHGRTKQEAGNGVQDTLGLSSRARSLDTTVSSFI